MTIAIMITTVTAAARLRRSFIDASSLRWTGAKITATTIAQRTAP
jgi:hypothetical protein